MVWMNNPSIASVAALPIVSQSFGVPLPVPAAATMSTAAAVAIGAGGLLALQGAAGAMWQRKRLARWCGCAPRRDTYDALPAGGGAAARSTA